MALTASLALSASAQQLYTKDASGNFLPVLDQTNGSPFLSGPGMDLLSTLTTATNWGVAGFGIYAPASAGHKAQMGAGVLALFNINKYMATGVGLDTIGGQSTMPSGQFQLQAPFVIGGTNGLTITPFAFTGAATAISGGGSGVVGLFGAGLDVKIYKGFGGFYAIEQRTGQSSRWNLFGLRYSVAL